MRVELRAAAPALQQRRHRLFLHEEILRRVEPHITVRSEGQQHDESERNVKRQLRAELVFN